MATINMTSEALQSAREADDDSEFRGIALDPDNMTALVHIFLNPFHDHLGRTSSTPPNMKFRVGEFFNLGTNEKYRARDDGQGNKFTAPVYCDYTIDGRRVESDYFCMDNVYFEMFPMYHGDGTSMRRNEAHGTSWMNIYLSEAGFEQFAQKFRRETGWALKDTQFRKDEKKKLVSISVSLDENYPPKWKEVYLEGGEIADRGKFDTILDNPKLHGLYRGTGLFSFKFNFVVPEDDTANTPSKQLRERDSTKHILQLMRCDSIGNLELYGRIRMKLIGVRIFGKEEKLTKVGSTAIPGL